LHTNVSIIYSFGGDVINRNLVVLKAFSVVVPIYLLPMRIASSRNLKCLPTNATHMGSAILTLYMIVPSAQSSP
jgi:hypothetical protein